MEEIKIINLIQAKRYIKNGVFPIRLEISKYTTKPTNDDDVLVFVFNKEDTVEVWEKWKNRSLA